MINLQSTNPTTKYLLGGGGGDDIFVIDSNGLSNPGGTVDLISSQVKLFGGVGNDSVVLDDSDDPSGDFVSIVPTGAESGKIGQGPTDNFFGVGGSVDYDQMAVVGLRTSNLADTVQVAPSTGTLIAVIGNKPTTADPKPHDTLNLDLSGVGMPKLSLIDFGAGELSSLTHASVFYAGIEIIDEATGGNRYDLVVDTNIGNLPGNDGVDDEVVAVSGQLLGRKTLNVRINGAPAFAGYEAAINSLTVIGSTDQDTLRIVETTDGLPSFPGVAIGSHTNAAFPAPGLTPTNVGIHFDGGTGSAIDQFDGILTSPQDAANFQDSVGPLKSGIVNIDGFFAMSYVNLEPILLQGAGGSLLIDATGLFDMTEMTLLILAGGVYKVSGDGGFETTTFSGFDRFFIQPPDGVTLRVIDDTTQNRLEGSFFLPKKTTIHDDLAARAAAFIGTDGSSATAGGNYFESLGNDLLLANPSRNDSDRDAPARGRKTNLRDGKSFSHESDFESEADLVLTIEEDWIS